MLCLMQDAIKYRLDAFYQLLNYEFSVFYSDLYDDAAKYVLLQTWRTLTKVNTFIVVHLTVQLLIAL